ncbi:MULTISPECIES: hypothetical protein [Flavobacteriaceae]|uniref:hypothetical protein n=1 Tax=Flavobacteriaceae TaxID=49546 RepID=UPI00234A2052|nr:hypothetical protein [Muricauda sp. SP22]MDC6362392.1 hypothetical protein [Muricauda sp. SP22]
MKRIRQIILGFFGLILVGVVVLIWVLQVNGIKVFSSEKPKYQPLVSKEDERTPEFEQGLDIFLNDCGQCHVTKGKLHNYLDGIVVKLGEEYLRLYLTKQDSLIENGDKLALSIKKEWGNQSNNHNFSYSEKELDFLMEYLK